VAVRRPARVSKFWGGPSDDGVPRNTEGKKVG
jgi:hypothetical protein